MEILLGKNEERLMVVGTVKTGPRGLLISGNLLAFKRDPLGFLRDAQEKYGDLSGADR